MRRLVILLAVVGVCSGLLAPIASAEAGRGAVFSGTGVWIDIWDALENDLDPLRLIHFLCESFRAQSSGIIGLS